MSKHTKETWTYKNQNGGAVVITQDGTTVYEDYPERECKVSHARARLIAAAPELLEAAEGVSDFVDTLGLPYSKYIPEGLVTKLVPLAKAINKAKAEGGE